MEKKNQFFTIFIETFNSNVFFFHYVIIKNFKLDFFFNYTLSE
jgi:hypothetical protein